MSTTLSAYRNLLRASRRAFQEDGAMLTAARSSIRQGFRDSATLEPSSPEFIAALKHAEDVASILRHNVVQGKREGEGDTYKLRIHGDTERGDNDSVKLSGGKGSGKCCSS